MAEEGDEVERAAGPPRQLKPTPRPFLKGARPYPKRGAPLPGPQAASDRQERRRRRWRITEAGVALAALMLSGSAFLIGAVQYLRGSDIAVLPPEEVLIYRDAGPSGASLWLAIPVSIVNAASPDYGDVALEATASLNDGPAGGRFRYLSIIEPVPLLSADRGEMERRVARAVENCPQAARCIGATGFYVVERPRRLLDVPGGSSRSDYLAFLLSAQNCAGPTDFCRHFQTDTTALAYLATRSRLRVRLEIVTRSDGRDEVDCLIATPPTTSHLIAYLRRTGWVMPACVRQGESS